MVCVITDEVTISSFICDQTSNCYYLDEFNSMSYFGSDGSLSWSYTSWDENGDNNSATGGDTMVYANELLLENSENDKNIKRALDLSGHTSAVISFDFRTEGTLDSEDILMVEVFDGTTWIGYWNTATLDRRQ